MFWHSHWNLRSLTQEIGHSEIGRSRLRSLWMIINSLPNSSVPCNATRRVNTKRINYLSCKLIFLSKRLRRASTQKRHGRMEDDRSFVFDMTQLTVGPSFAILSKKCIIYYFTVSKTVRLLFLEARRAKCRREVKTIRLCGPLKLLES